MNRHISSSYSFRAQLLHRLVASCIILALFLSPIEVPLSELVVAPETTPDTALESNRELANNDTIKADTAGNVTYTRGATEPQVAFDAPVYDTPISIKEVLPTSSTSLDLAIMEQAKTVALIPKQLTARAQNNHSAARLLAAGKTGSELASVTLDAEGNIVATSDIHGSTETAEYNNNGQPLKITEGDGTTVYYKYDSDGRLLGVSREGESAIATASGISGFAQRLVAPLFALADVADDTVGFDYEADSMTTAQNNVGVVTYEYDEYGLVTLETRLDGSQVEYEYDELGNVVTTIEVPAETNNSFSLRSFLRFSYASNPLLQTTQEFSDYDDNSRLRSYRIAVVNESPIPDNSVPTIETSTDISPAPGVSTTTATTSQAITTDTTTPEAGASTTVVSTPTDTTYSSTSTPEDTSNVQIIEAVLEEIISYISETTTTVAYWFQGLLQRSFAETTTTAVDTETAPSATINAASSTLYSISFNYDAHGNIVSSETNTGIKTTHAYDAISDSLISTVVTTPSGQTSNHSYTSDNFARLRTYNNDSYTYNEAGILIATRDSSYSYDTNGNRSETSGRNAATYTYNGNRLLSTTYADGRSVHYEYDNRGAVVRIVDSSEGTTNFTYNLAGAISTITHGTTVISYEYDALNRRTSRATADGIINYHYNSGQLKRVTNEAGVTIREYFYTPSGLLTAVQVDGTIYHTITNYNRSLLGLIDTSTGQLYETTYDAWGNIMSNNLPVTLDIGYIGAFVEPSLGYSILGPRVYDPEIGRFLSKDPLPGAQLDLLSQNEYIYAKNDPVNQYDPSGHASELAAKSTSPKRSLIETNNAIEVLQAELKDAEATLFITDSTDTEAYSLAQLDVTNLENALSELYAIKADTEATIAKNEADTVTTPEPAPVAVNTIHWGVGEVSASSTDTGSTLPTEESSTSTASTTTVTIESHSSTTSPETLEQSASEVEEVEIPTVPLDTPTPANETTPALPVTVSFGKTSGISGFISTITGEQLLKAEAKKKKSKAKKAKKDKKKASATAKSKKESKATQLSSLKKKLSSLQSKLTATQNKNAKRKITKRELERINREVQTVAVSVLSLRVDDLIRQRDAANEANAERARQQALATAANNLNTNTNTQIKAITVTPAAPAVSAVFGPTELPQSAGVQAPRLTFEQPTVPWWKTATSVAVSLVPVVGEFYDGWTIYAQKDPITGERLTLLGNAFTVIGLGTIAGSGKAAREIGERAIREIATSRGIDYDLVNNAAEEVIKEVDLVALAAKGKSGYDELITKISERAAKKNADFMAKGTVSAATIAKFQDRIDRDRIVHILDGEFDADYNIMTGGHRYGQAVRKAREGKFFNTKHTEFPESWSDDKILENALLVLKSTDSEKYVQPDGKIRYDLVIDSTNVRTVFDPVSQKVITAFPLN